MYEPQTTNIKLNVGHIDRKIVPIRKPVNLKSVIEHINSQRYDDYVKNRLIKAAGKYPHDALRYFLKNIQQYISRIHIERKKEILESEKNESRELEGSLLPYIKKENENGINGESDSEASEGPEEISNEKETEVNKT